LTNGFIIRLIRHEHSEVRRDELQLLEGTDVGLPHSSQLHQPNRERHDSNNVQAERLGET
jgi:hypothetical protein